MHLGALRREPTKPARPASSYVPGLDGLRAVAIAGVLFGHAGFTALPGAAIHGVSVFFAVSGYLITELLVREFESDGRIDMRAFYRRRFARLLPALLVALVASSLYLTLSGAAVRSWVTGPLAALAYVMNDAVAFGWLGSGSARHMFEYTWSLSLEEQFYVAWPLLVAVLLGRRRGRAILSGIAVAVCLASPLWRHHLSAAGAEFHRVAWATDTRIDAMLGGCLLALALRVPAVRAVAARWASLAFVLGAAALALLSRNGAVFFLDPGGYSAASLATCLVVAALVLRPASSFSRVLSGRVIAYLGRLSYSIYLFNVLMLTLFERVVGEVPADRWWGTPAWVAACVAAADLSYRFVEVPLRNRWRARRADVPRSEESFTSAGFVASSATVERLVRTSVGSRRVGAAWWAVTHPGRLVALVRWVRDLPTVTVQLSDSCGGRVLRARLGRSRAGLPVGRMARAVLVLPDSSERWKRGKARQALRTNLTAAARAGLVARRLAPEEVHASVCAVCAERRWGRDPRAEVERQLGVRLEEAIAVEVTDAQGVVQSMTLALPAGGAVQLVWAMGVDRGPARWLGFAGLVDTAIAEGARVVLVDSAFSLDAGVTHFQHLLGFRPAHVVVASAATSRALTGRTSWNPLVASFAQHPPT